MWLLEMGSSMKCGVVHGCIVIANIILYFVMVMACCVALDCRTAMGDSSIVMNLNLKAHKNLFDGRHVTLQPINDSCRIQCLLSVSAMKFTPQPRRQTLEAERMSGLPTVNFRGYRHYPTTALTEPFFRLLHQFLFMSSHVTTSLQA